MKERVNLEIKTMADAINSLGYLHIDAAKGEQLMTLIKDLWAENQKLKADRQAVHGAIEVNKLVTEELEENLRIAIEALTAINNYAFDESRKGLDFKDAKPWYELTRLAKQALSTIRGE